MKIPNYDKEKKKSSDKELTYMPKDFRLLICGESNSGKTNLVLHMIIKSLIYYDKIYLYTPNPHQDKIQSLKEIMDKISSQVGYNVLEIGNQDEIRDTEEYPNNNRKVVIFDDLINAPQHTQQKIANFYTNGRHRNLSAIYLSQSYYDVSKKIRLNCDHMILYSPIIQGHKNLISRENSFKSILFNKLKKYEFLFIDKNSKTIKKIFDENI